MRILITGGAGFIGSNLSDFYLKNDHEVIIFDSLARANTEKNLEWLKSNHKKGLSFINGDVRKFDQLKTAVKGIDIIFHTAAQVAVTTSVKNPREDFDINALGTFNVLEAARLSNSNPTIAFTSTNKVYGNNVNIVPLVEKDTRYDFSDPKFLNGISEDFSTGADEHTPYGCSKYIADTYMRDYAAVYGSNTVVFRMSCIYGTRQFGTEDQGWVVHFVISSILSRPLTIYGDGKQVRDILFIQDLVNAFNLGTKNISKTKGNAYNIGGGPDNTISLLELISFLEKITNKKINYEFGDWRPFDQKVYYSNIAKAKKDFGWEPKISKEEGIERLIEWVNSNKQLFS